MAVYTDVDLESLETFLAEYDIGQVRTFKGIAEGVENSNFVLGTTAGEYILTLYEKRVAAAKIFPIFIDLMDHLAGRRFPLPRSDPRSGWQSLARTL